RFYQVDKSRSTLDGKSAGLGLAIASEIVRAHNGEIKIESDPGRGTTVRVTLPIYRQATEPASQKRGLLKRLGQSNQRQQTAPLPPAANGRDTEPHPETIHSS